MNYELINEVKMENKISLLNKMTELRNRNLILKKVSQESNVSLLKSSLDFGIKNL